MAESVTWTDSAWADLEEAADYIARDSPFYASVFVDRTKAAARSLPAQPRRGRDVPELDQASIRELLLGNYRLLYELREEQIYILGVIHGARDLAALWEREGR